MNSVSPRERVRWALSHQETDRTPVDFLATPESLLRLQQFLGLPDEESVLQRLGIDLRHPRQVYKGPSPSRRPRQAWKGPSPTRDREGSWTDAWGVGRRPVRHCGGAYDEIVVHPLAELKSAKDLDEYPWPRVEWWDPESLQAQIDGHDRRGPYAIALPEFGDPGGIFEIAWYLRGMEAFLIDMVERPELAFEIMRRVTDFYIAQLDRVMSAVGERVDLIWTSDDIAHQHGPLISKALWRELIAPHHSRLNQRIHESGAQVMYHSCGAVRSFVPHLIEIGVDVLDVLQFSADGMDPLEFKNSCGRRLCFHGGVDVQQLLPFADEAQVKNRVRELIAVLGEGGGYILAPTHNIQVDTPPENVLAIYAAAGSLEAADWSRS